MGIKRIEEVGGNYHKVDLKSAALAKVPTRTGGCRKFSSVAVRKSNFWISRQHIW
ncbi:unnamed protein product [Rhodiola kirilowii]